MMDFDTMLEHVGEFGKYQKILFLFQAPFAFFLSFSLFGQLFMILAPLNYWCSNVQFSGGLLDGQRRNITSPFDNPCQRFIVNSRSSNHLQEFLNYLNSDGVCNNGDTSGSCINECGSRTISKRQVYQPPRFPNRLSSQGATTATTTIITTISSARSTTSTSTTTTTTTTATSSSNRNGESRIEASLVSQSCGQETWTMGPETWLNTSVAPQTKPEGWETGACGRNWTHNQTEFPYTTILTEAGYWCDTLPNLSLDAKLTICQSIFYVGAIIGGVIIGQVADNYGRVPALVSANLLGLVGGALSVSTTNFYWFCVFRFIAGMSFDNCFTMIYILVLEYVGPSYRTLVANLSIAVFYTMGTVSIPGLFVLIKDWRWFGLAISLPMLLTLVAIFVVPESARWLVSRGRIKEASNILRSFGKMNGKHVEEKLFTEFEETSQEMFEELSKEKPVSLLEALKRPKICKNFILLVIIWSLIALMYDGHSRNVLNLGSNVYIMFAVASSLELPADLILVFFLDIIGRRWLAFGSLFLAATFSLISAVPAIAMNGSTLLIFALISRFWVNVSFNIGLQYAAELLPTVIRAQGVNFIHIMGYVASIISPFIASIGRENVSLSLTILGGCSLVAAICSLFLPETLGEDLPNTLEDGESFGKHQSFWNCPMCTKPREPEEEPITRVDPTPAVTLRNNMRASLRGEGFRSSLLVRHSVLRKPVVLNPSPAHELHNLRRVNTVR